MRGEQHPSEFLTSLWRDSVPVHSVAEMHWNLGKTSCDCGGGFQFLGSAHTFDHLSRVFHVLRAACTECGTERKFVFRLESIDPHIKLHPFLLEPCIRSYRESSKNPQRTAEELERLILAYLTGYLSGGTGYTQEAARLMDEFSHGKASADAGRVLYQAVLHVLDWETREGGIDESYMRTLGEGDRDEQELAAEEAADREKTQPKKGTTESPRTSSETDGLCDPGDALSNLKEGESLSGFIPHQIEPDETGDSRLVGFPRNLLYARVRSDPAGKLYGLIAEYFPDPQSFVEDQRTRKMTYYPRERGEYWVLVEHEKETGSWHTWKYKGPSAIRFSEGRDFREAMMYTTICGPEPDEWTETYSGPAGGADIVA